MASAPTQTTSRKPEDNDRKARFSSSPDTSASALTPFLFSCLAIDRAYVFLRQKHNARGLSPLKLLIRHAMREATCNVLSFLSTTYLGAGVASSAHNRGRASSSFLCKKIKGSDSSGSGLSNSFRRYAAPLIKTLFDGNFSLRLFPVAWYKRSVLFLRSSMPTDGAGRARGYFVGTSPLSVRSVRSTRGIWPVCASCLPSFCGSPSPSLSLVPPSSTVSLSPAASEFRDCFSVSLSDSGSSTTSPPSSLGSEVKAASLDSSSKPSLSSLDSTVYMNPEHGLSSLNQSLSSWTN
mmetsp:Transcript_23476/g.51041  ORF Transcript_23476/g.51041 Transcript_23476/m.51041 type:complete len:293 (-) Transcript_23476:1661-2539(-)